MKLKASFSESVPICGENSLRALRGSAFNAEAQRNDGFWLMAIGYRNMGSNSRISIAHSCIGSLVGNHVHALIPSPAPTERGRGEP
ncbi:hypothetical protein JOD20_004656 [Herpetosiphon giganteus]|nr:hypothetical protein [Herpetosiphon giganteus]